MSDLIDCAMGASPLPSDGPQEGGQGRSNLGRPVVFREGRWMENKDQVIADAALRKQRTARGQELSGLNADAIKRFLDVAARGRSGAASGGEQRAQKIAAGILPLIDDLWGIDGEAIDGLCELMRCASIQGELVKGLLAPVVAKKKTSTSTLKHS